MTMIATHVARTRRIGALAARIFRQFLRDRRTLVLMFVVPIVIMGLLTWVMKAESEPFRTAVVAPSEDGAMVRDILIELLSDNANVTIVEGLAEPDLMAALRDGRLQGAVVLRAGGIEGLKRGERMKLEVMLEGSDPMVSGQFLREFQRVLRPMVDALRGLLYLSDDDIEMIAPPEVEFAYLYGGADFNETDYLAPPVIAFLAFFFVFLLTAVSFLRERAQGTMERLLASPLTRFEIVSGYLLGFLAFALAQTAVVIIFVLYVLKIHYAGSLASILLIELALVLGASNMGILFSSFAKNEFQVAQFIPLVIVPQVFLSGVLWSVETMPRVLQYIAYALPLTYANQALRKLMIKGFTLGQVTPELAALTLFAVLMVIASIVSMQKRI